MYGVLERCWAMAMRLKAGLLRGQQGHKLSNITTMVEGYRCTGTIMEEGE